MSKPIKVLILLFALIASVFAVLVFAKTIAKPPVDMHFPNSHMRALEKDIQSMTEAFSEEDQFDLIKKELEFQTKEHFLNKSEHDMIADLLVTTYVPLFRSYSWSCFSSNSWSERDMAAIQNRCESLKSLSLKETQAKPLDSHEELSKQFDSVCGVVSDYNTAVSIAKSTAYTSIGNARDVISRANSLKNKYPLNNNTALVNQLTELPSKIEQSHYNSLSNSVDKLIYIELNNYWSNNTYDSLRFENYCTAIYHDMVDYRDKTYFYPNHHDISYLIKLAQNRRKDAIERYFNLGSRSKRSRR